MPYGYYTQSGYQGYVASIGKYILFATEDDYLDYIS